MRKTKATTSSTTTSASPIRYKQMRQKNNLAVHKSRNKKKSAYQELFNQVQTLKVEKSGVVTRQQNAKSSIHGQKSKISIQIRSILGRGISDENLSRFMKMVKKSPTTTLTIDQLNKCGKIPTMSEPKLKVNYIPRIQNFKNDNESNVIIYKEQPTNIGLDTMTPMDQQLNCLEPSKSTPYVYVDTSMNVFNPPTTYFNINNEGIPDNLPMTPDSLTSLSPMHYNSTEVQQDQVFTTLTAYQNNGDVNPFDSSQCSTITNDPLLGTNTSAQKVLIESKAIIKSYSDVKPPIPQLLPIDSNLTQLSTPLFEIDTHVSSIPLSNPYNGIITETEYFPSCSTSIALAPNPSPVTEMVQSPLEMNLLKQDDPITFFEHDGFVADDCSTSPNWFSVIEEITESQSQIPRGTFSISTELNIF